MVNKYGRDVKLEDIKKGDLVEMTYFSGKKALGYVSEVYSEDVMAYWSDSRGFEDIEHFENITGHWKVINFEEENKMKVYTGKEAIKALLEGKTLKVYRWNSMYRMNDILEVDLGNGWEDSRLTLNSAMKMEFTEYVQLPQVGDWVKVCGYVGEITKVDENFMHAYWSNIPTMEAPISLKHHGWEVLTPEQVTEYKREQVFAKAGRKLNEFKPNDVIEVETPFSETVNMLVHSVDDFKVRLKRSIADTDSATWYHSKNLTPVYFVESKVNIDE